MDFTPTPERQMLANSLGRLLADTYGMEQRHRIAGSDAGWSRQVWRDLAELGVVGALFAEGVGGFGGTGFDIAAVFEPLGRRLVVEPFLGALMAGRALASAGGQERLTEEVVAGARVLAFAHQEAQGRHDLAVVASRAEREGDAWRLNGCKSVVPQIEAADRIVVSASTADGMELFLVDRDAEGVGVRGYPLIDGGRGGDLTLEAAPATLLGAPGGGGALLADSVAAGLVALSWEAVGVMEELKAATLNYLRTRKQFGVPIGSFQALQHRMATVALEIEQARSAAINAAAALETEPRLRDRAASAAKFTIGRVGTLVAEEAIQMHGGIGMTWELPLSHYAKRLIMIDHQLGDEDHHLARYAALGRAEASPA